VGFSLKSIHTVQVALHNDLQFMKSVAIDHLSRYSADLVRSMTEEVKISSLKSEKMDYTHTRALFLNESGSAFLEAPPANVFIFALIARVRPPHAGTKFATQLLEGSFCEVFNCGRRINGTADTTFLLS
jgi:hypothetical protein